VLVRRDEQRNPCQGGFGQDQGIVQLILRKQPAEQELRRALTISQGDWTVFFTRPLSATLIAIALLALAGPQIWAAMQRRK